MMNKKLIGAIALVILFGLTSCGKTVEEKTNASTTAEETKNDASAEYVYDTTAKDNTSTSTSDVNSISNDILKIENIGGGYYLNFVEGNVVDESVINTTDSSMVANIFFSSLSDMRDKLINGSLSPNEINELKAKLTLTDKGFELFNVQSLYDVVLPNDSWSQLAASIVEDEYGVFFESQAEEAYGNIVFCSDESYVTSYNMEVRDYFEEKKEYILPDMTEYLGYPCVAYEYETKFAKIRKVMFQLENEYGYVDVIVKYCLENTLRPERGNAEIPQSITFYGTDNRQKYIIRLEVSDAPTKELFTSFEVVPFEN